MPGTTQSQNPKLPLVNPPKILSVLQVHLFPPATPPLALRRVHWSLNPAALRQLGKGTVVVEAVFVEEAEWAVLAGNMPHCQMCHGLADWITEKHSVRRKSGKSWGHGHGVLAEKRWLGCLGRSAGKKLWIRVKLKYWCLTYSTH